MTKAGEMKLELENILCHFRMCLSAEQRARFGVYTEAGQDPHMAVMRCLSVLEDLDCATGRQATYAKGWLNNQQPK